MRIIALFAALPLLAGCGQKPGATGIDPQDAAKVARGQAVYTASCAACHGANLEGQPDWRSRKPDGRMPAPRMTIPGTHSIIRTRYCSASPRRASCRASTARPAT